MTDTANCFIPTCTLKGPLHLNNLSIIFQGVERCNPFPIIFSKRNSFLIPWLSVSDTEGKDQQLIFLVVKSLQS